MNRKRTLMILAILLALLLIVGACLYGPRLLKKTGADLGGFSGDSDYGDSDSGSSWSSSDSGSNWGGSDYGRSSSGYHSSSKGEPMSTFEKIILFLFITVFLYLVFCGFLGHHGILPPLPYKALEALLPQPALQHKPAGAERTPTSRLRPMSEYAKVDPNFSESDMVKQFSNLYVRMQEGCTARNIEGIRHWFSDGLYQQFDRQLKDLTDKGWINHVEDIHIENVELRGWFFEGGKDHLVAEVKTQIVDYTVNEDSGALISGSKTARKHMTYEWDLSRPMGTLTPKTGETVERRCPNCGATLTANESAKCPYCGAVITFKDHDWTIYAIKGIAQETEHNYPCWPDV